MAPTPPLRYCTANSCPIFSPASSDPVSSFIFSFKDAISFFLPSSVTLSFLSSSSSIVSLTLAILFKTNTNTKIMPVVKKTELKCDLEKGPVFCGTPNTEKGVPSHIDADPSGNTDWVTYPSGKTAVVRSLSDPLQSFVFVNHVHPVTACRFAPDGSMVASGDKGGSVRVWVPEESMKEKAECWPAVDEVCDIVISTCKQFIGVASASRGSGVGYAKLNGTNVGGYPHHNKTVYSIDFSPTKPYVTATCGLDFMTGCFHAPPPNTPGKLEGAYAIHKGFANQVRFAPDGETFASVGSDRKLITYRKNSETNKSVDVIKEYECSEGSILGMSWNPDGKKVYLACTDKKVRLFDIESEQNIATCDFEDSPHFMQSAITYCKKSNQVASVSLNSQINVLDGDKLEKQATLYGHSVQIVGIAASQGKLFTADYLGVCVAWEPGKGPAPLQFNGTNQPTNAAFVGGNEKCIVIFGVDGNLFIVDTQTLTFPDKTPTVEGGSRGLSIASADAPVLGAVINEDRAAVFTQDGSIGEYITFEKNTIGTCIAINPQGTKVAIGVLRPGEVGELRLGDVVDNKIILDGVAITQRGAVTSVVFSADGTKVATTDGNYACQFTLTGEKLKGGGSYHSAKVLAMAYTPDGQYLATGGADSNLCVWKDGSAFFKKVVQTAHKFGVYGVTLLDDWIYTCGGDNCVRAWKIPA